VTNAEAAIPTRIWIRPDDYHVPLAGTAGDGRRFFLTRELFAVTPGRLRTFVALFLWAADGTFDEIKVEESSPEPGRPPGNSRADDVNGVGEKWLSTLGTLTLEPIEVEPFSFISDGVEFGFIPQEYDDMVSVNLMLGDVIAYYEPWDGFEYDT